MNNISKGRCLCGASGFEFHGVAAFAIRCFCRDCQHVSGGGHLPQMGVSAEGFMHFGKVKLFTKPSDAGNELGFSFCADCGAPLFKTTSKMPDTVFVYPGALDAPPDADFSQAVFETSRAVWDSA